MPNEDEAEQARRDLEYELAHGRFQEASRMTWEAFRERFENEHVAGMRPDTQVNYKATFDIFERICNPTKLKSVTERTISLFVAGMRKEKGRGARATTECSTGMMASTIKVRL